MEKCSRSPRILSHRDEKGNERCTSPNRKHRRSGGATCVLHQRHMYYKWLLWFNHQNDSHMDENGKLEQKERV